MSAPIDHLTYNRLAVATAYRRLADSALAAAEVYTNPEAVPHETTAANATAGRVDSVRHALAVLAATRRGIAKARGAAA